MAPLSSPLPPALPTCITSAHRSRRRESGSCGTRGRRRLAGLHATKSCSPAMFAARLEKSAAPTDPLPADPDADCSLKASHADGPTFGDISLLEESSAKCCPDLPAKDDKERINERGGELCRIPTTYLDWDSDEEVLSGSDSEEEGTEVRGVIMKMMADEVQLMCHTVLQAMEPSVSMGRIRPSSRSASPACVFDAVDSESQQAPRRDVRSRSRQPSRSRRVASAPTLPPFPQSWKDADLDPTEPAVSKGSGLLTEANSERTPAANAVIGERLQGIDDRLQLRERRLGKVLPPVMPPCGAQSGATFSRHRVEMRMDIGEAKGGDAVAPPRDSSLERSYNILGAEFHSMATPTAVRLTPLSSSPRIQKSAANLFGHLDA